MLLISEGDFGSVYRGTLIHHNHHRSQIDIAIKQLNCNGNQTCLIFPNSFNFFEKLSFFLYIKLCCFNIKIEFMLLL